MTSSPFCSGLSDFGPHAVISVALNPTGSKIDSQLILSIERLLSEEPKMAQYVRVTEDESLPAIELPTESDGAILLSTLQAQFPGACGLRYKNPETDSWRGIRLLDNMLCPPADEGWGCHLYVVVQKNDNTSLTKRKIEESPNAVKEPESKMTKISSSDDAGRLGDLIVLGLPWKTTSEDMKEYFQKFGEVTMAEVKMDYSSGKSRGFGFVHFKDPEVEKTVLSQVHHIQGRTCEVRLPRCKQDFMPKKLFVGRLPDGTTETDLLEHFSKFGEVIDVYIPKPMRGISFVTFASGEVAKKVQSQNHRLGTNLLNVSFAEPKAAKNSHMPFSNMQSMSSQNSAPGGWGGGMGFDMYGMNSFSEGGRQNVPYNMSAAYNTMMQSMLNMGNPSSASTNVMGNRQNRR